MKKSPHNILWIFLSSFFSILILVSCSNTPQNTSARVRIAFQNNQYILYRNGQPYKINGAAGSANLNVLKESGGNTIRIWDTTNLSNILENAHKNNIAVIVGLPVMESVHKDYYSNTIKTELQFQSIKALINKYKNDPAILMWCLGNELYFPKALGNSKFYKAFNQMVDMIHKDDPDHPITTTMVNFQPLQIFELNINTNIDLISFNIFGQLSNFRNDLKSYSWLWKGPYLILEWGINGPWGDDQQTAWGAFLEPSSTTKAPLYIERHQKNIPVEDHRFLGSFIFNWGQKQETTHTWFSLFDEDGYKTESVNAAQYIWTGKHSTNSVPQIKDLVINQKYAYDNIILLPGDTVNAEVSLAKIDTSINKIKWAVYPEDWYKKNNTNNEIRPNVLSSISTNQAELKTEFIVPTKEGPYRLFVSIYDSNGYTANANIPFYVLQKK